MENTTRPGQKVGRDKRTTDRVRFRRFVFTLNNYTDVEVKSIQEFPCQWMIFGRETCPTTGTLHLQGAVVLGRQMDLQTLKSGPFKRAHLAVMKGTPVQSMDYCSKEDPNPFTKGMMPEPGKRTDLHNVCEQLRSGKTVRDLVKDDDSGPVIVKYYKGLLSYSNLLGSDVREQPVVLWIYGDTGVGKTRAAVEFARRFARFWMSNGSLRWFDGYLGEPVVILDDIRADSCSFDFLLRLLDRYPFRVEYKGGFIDWNPTHIIVTSWGSPEEIFNLKGQGDLSQLSRRISNVIQLKQGESLSLWEKYGGSESTELGAEDNSSGSELDLQDE